LLSIGREGGESSYFPRLDLHLECLRSWESEYGKIQLQRGRSMKLPLIPLREVFAEHELGFVSRVKCFSVLSLLRLRFI